jgi:hypothetical protein
MTFKSVQQALMLGPARPGAWRPHFCQTTRTQGTYVAGVFRDRHNGWQGGSYQGGDSSVWENRGIVLLAAVTIALLVAAGAVGAGVVHR